jgi:hypothetical protein
MIDKVDNLRAAPLRAQFGGKRRVIGGEEFPSEMRIRQQRACI